MSAEQFDLIKNQPFYNQKTIWLDNLLTKKLKEK
jgi:hypothetical protein